mgnify:CR=1 FL=1
MNNNQIIVTTSQELHALIRDAINVAVRQISLPQKVDPLPDYLTIDELSAFLKLAKPTIYGFVSKRTLPFIKRGKRLYFSRLNIIQWLEEGKKKTKNEILINNFKQSIKYS